VSVPPLAAVQFVSAAEGWVAGAGQILATVDGGLSWHRQYRGPAQLDQVDFVDARHGWAVGTASLLVTTDGGARWTALPEPCPPIRSVHFIDAQSGWAVAGGSDLRIDGGLPAPVSGGELLATSDGGTHWRPVTAAPAHAQTACFTNGTDGWLGTPGRLWRSTDGGRHWSLSFTEPRGYAHRLPGDTAVLECAGPAAAWVLFLGSGAALSHSPYIAFASPDGRRWRPVLEETYTESALIPSVHVPDGPGSYPGPFSAVSPSVAAFAGYTPPIGFGAAGLDIAADGGARVSWRGMIAGITDPSGVAFISPQQGWVVGTDQLGQTRRRYVIEQTTDGGARWVRQYAAG
jgi:hypothetical protein